MDLGDVGVAILQELWKKVASSAAVLGSETKDVMFEKESFREFSNHIARLGILLEGCRPKRVQTTSFESTKDSLKSLHSQLNSATNIIKEYKSGSKLRFMLNSHSVLEQMQKLATEIAGTISLLEFTNIDATLHLKSETDKVINSLRSIEFSSKSATEAVVSEIEKSMARHAINHDHSMALLQKIAEACGTSADASLKQNELSLLKQEKEEMEAQKKQAEALQLSQLITLLNSSDIMPDKPEEGSTIFGSDAIISFTCPLCNEMMADPVAIVCGHSFEKRAIQQHFTEGAISCPVCKQELTSFELTPNLALRNSIQEWKQRDTEMNFQSAVSGITSTDQNIVSQSLDSLQDLMEMPRYRDIVSEKRLIPKMVEFVRQNNGNTPAALKCLYHLSCHSDENKEIMVNAGALRYIVKYLYKGEAHNDAVAILLELSKKETLAEEIGNAKDCIPLLVTMLDDVNNAVAEKAKMVLENLSFATHFVIKMAEAEYFTPFVSRFNEGTFEARASMAAALVEIQIGDDNIVSFRHKQFIFKLVEMLASEIPAYIKACLKCTKKLLQYPMMSEWFLADTHTIPHLINLTSVDSAETHSRLETAEVLTSLIENLQLSDSDEIPDLQELYSQHNVNIFMSFVITSESPQKLKFLQLLNVLTRRSETAQISVRSHKDVLDKLFRLLNGDHPEVRLQLMKLISNISENHPDGVPLPPEPAKEYVINALVAILKNSIDNEERSVAARIISHLPPNDVSIDKILHRSETLKAIQEVLHNVDNEHMHSGSREPTSPDELLLENALAALLRYTQPTKPDLQKQVCELELYPSLVRVLSRGSSLAKEFASTALAHLSQSTNALVNEANTISKRSSSAVPQLFLDNVLCCFYSSAAKRICSVHGSACSSRYTVCLVKADAVRPLVQTLSETQSGAAEAALKALNTMLIDKKTITRATSVIVDNKGVESILEVLEKGTQSAKDEALNLLQKVLENTKTPHLWSSRAEMILINLLADDALKRKTALVLAQMKKLPEQSSYF